MQDHSEGFLSKEHNPKEHSINNLTHPAYDANRTSPAWLIADAAPRSIIAQAQARLRALDLDGLRDAYRTVTAAAGSVGSAEAQAALQLDRTLIRQEIRRRGISLYDLFSACEVGVKE